LSVAVSIIFAIVCFILIGLFNMPPRVGLSVCAAVFAANRFYDLETRMKSLFGDSLWREEIYLFFVACWFMYFAYYVYLFCTMDIYRWCNKWNKWLLDNPIRFSSQVSSRRSSSSTSRPASSSPS
jgi:hypothetical protein